MLCLNYCISCFISFPVDIDVLQSCGSGFIHDGIRALCRSLTDEENNNPEQ